MLFSSLPAPSMIQRYKPTQRQNRNPAKLAEEHCQSPILKTPTNDACCWVHLPPRAPSNIALLTVLNTPHV